MSHRARSVSAGTSASTKGVPRHSASAARSDSTRTAIGPNTRKSITDHPTRPVQLCGILALAVRSAAARLHSRT